MTFDDFLRGVVADSLGGDIEPGSPFAEVQAALQDAQRALDSATKNHAAGLADLVHLDLMGVEDAVNRIAGQLLVEFGAFEAGEAW